VNIEVIRTFVHLRQILSTHKDRARKLEELEKKYDYQDIAGELQKILDELA
jgi:hypothetical protein